MNKPVFRASRFKPEADIWDLPTIPLSRREGLVGNPSQGRRSTDVRYQAARDISFDPWSQEPDLHRNVISQNEVYRSRVNRRITQTMRETPTAPAVFHGYQEGWRGRPGFQMYNLTQDVVGHRAGSTVSGETLKKLGYRLPPIARPNSNVAHNVIKGIEEGGFFRKLLRRLFTAFGSPW